MRAPVIKWSSVRGGENLVSQKSGPMSPLPTPFPFRCLSALPHLPLAFRFLLYITCPADTGGGASLELEGRAAGPAA